MTPVSIKTKLLSLFVLTFLCLNAGGAVCLAFCANTKAHDMAAMDHCPLAKKPADCPHHAAKQEQDGAPAVESKAVSCCNVAINIFAVPLERKQTVQDPVQTTPLETTQTIISFVSSSFTAPVTTVSRQPALDRRVERVKHCVFRI